MAIELECKLPLPAREPLVAKLRALGAEALGEVRESNWVLDAPADTLRQRHRLLRVRSLDGREEGVITFKQPAPPGEFKRREELEFVVGSAPAARRLLAELGYESKWFYEKRRDRWRYQGCEIFLDLLPEIGCFIEIEGPDESAIKKVLAQLELDPSAHIAGSYRQLFAQSRAARGQPFGDMRFA